MVPSITLKPTDAHVMIWCVRADALLANFTCPNRKTTIFVTISAQWAKNSSEDDGVSVEMVFSQYDQEGSGSIDPLEVRGGPTLIVKPQTREGVMCSNYLYVFFETPSCRSTATIPPKYFPPKIIARGTLSRLKYDRCLYSHPGG